MSLPPCTFDGFRFDSATGELTGPAGAIRLGPQPARLLELLLSSPGVLVTRQELKQALWPDTNVEADQGLNFCVLQLRTALGDDAAQSRFIETLPRRGYRFIAPVEGPAPVRTKAGRTVAPPRLIALGVLGVAAAVATFAVSATLLRDNRNVAVMPFSSKPGEPAWISDVGTGINDRLVTLLTAAADGRIGVVGPLTTQRFVGDLRPLAQVAAELHVAYVMSASVRASDSTVFVQVVRAADGVHLCAFRRRVPGANLDTVVGAVVSATADRIVNGTKASDAAFGCKR